MLNKEKYPLGHYWIYSEESDFVDPKQLASWSKWMLAEAGQKILKDGMLARAYFPEKGYYAWDIEECLRALVRAGELMNPDMALLVPAKLPTRSDLQIRFGKQLQDLRFGIECGDGWNGLLHVMFEAVEMAQAFGDVPEDFRWAQIKEKFGTIRMYHPPQLPGFRQLEHITDKASEVTCEVCGHPGQLFTEGWCKVRCPQHAEASK